MFVIYIIKYLESVTCVIDFFIIRVRMLIVTLDHEPSLFCIIIYRNNNHNLFLIINIKYDFF